MPTLTVTDLRDPAPPTPGPVHRAAVAVRARQLSRRRRFTQIGGAVAVIAVLAVGGVAVASSGSNQAGRVVVQLASVTGSTTSPPVSTLTVTFTGDQKTVTVDADPSGTFTISNLPPGDYLVVWTYETSGPAPTGGVDIGTALSGGRIHVNLSSGNNSVSIPLPH
jgi:hypothetical protein